MQVGIIGCGNMGRAVAKKLAKDHSLMLCGRNEKRLAPFAKELTAKYTTDPREVVKDCDIVFLAVKPKDFLLLAETISPFLSKETLLISLLAGVTREMLKKHLSTGVHVKIMPNLAIASGVGVVAVENDGLENETIEQVKALLRPLGSTYFVASTVFDAFAAISGAGPAFLCVFIEGLIEAGIQLGMPADLAMKVSLETVSGTVAYIKEENISTQQYRWQNCSPGGTTIEGIHLLEQEGMRGSVMSACKAAHEKVH